MSNIIILNPQPKQPIEDYVEHDLPLLVKEKPKSLSWESHDCIIVASDAKPVRQRRGYVTFRDGCKIDWEEAFVIQLMKYGFDVFIDTDIRCFSPRNSFLSFDDFIVASKEDSDKGLTNGGACVFGRDFVLVSDSLIRYISGGGFIYRSLLDERTVRKFWEAFGIDKVYFIPPAQKTPHSTPIGGGDYGEKIADLDYTINSIPWLDTYTVDEEHYEEQKENFRRVEKENNIEFEKLKTTKLDGGDLWVNGYIAISKQEENKRVTHLFYNSLTWSAGEIHPYASIPMQRRFAGYPRPGYVYGADPNFETHPTLIPMRNSFRGTLHCITHTTPDKNSYEEFRNLMGWPQRYGKIWTDSKR